MLSGASVVGDVNFQWISISTIKWKPIYYGFSFLWKAYFHFALDGRRKLRHLCAFQLLKLYYAWKRNGEDEVEQWIHSPNHEIVVAFDALRNNFILVPLNPDMNSWQIQKDVLQMPCTQLIAVTSQRRIASSREIVLRMRMCTPSVGQPQTHVAFFVRLRRTYRRHISLSSSIANVQSEIFAHAYVVRCFCIHNFCPLLIFWCILYAYSMFEIYCGKWWHVEDEDEMEYFASELRHSLLDSGVRNRRVVTSYHWTHYLQCYEYFAYRVAPNWLWAMVWFKRNHLGFRLKSQSERDTNICWFYLIEFHFSILFFFPLSCLQFPITYDHVYAHCPNDPITRARVTICIACVRFRSAKAPSSTAAIQLYQDDHVVTRVWIQRPVGK